MSETGLLEDSKPKYVTEETELLSDDQNTVLLIEDQETEWLVDNVSDSMERTGGKTIEQLEEVMLIHTNEIIDI